MKRKLAFNKWGMFIILDINIEFSLKTYEWADDLGIIKASCALWRRLQTDKLYSVDLS